MPSLLSRIATGLAPVAAIVLAFAVLGGVAASSAEARERPRGDWHRYCKDIDVRGAWLEADCRKTNGNWRRNTRINFDACPGNEVTVRNGRLVCERRYGRDNRWDHHWDQRGWDDRRYGWDRRDGNKHGWDKHGWDKRDWDKRDWKRRDSNRKADWDRNRDPRGRDGWTHDRRDRDKRYDWSKHRDDERRKVDRRDDRRRDHDRDEWWKRGNG